tara:strand:+ start:407 stop:643 length:237 start_codon:yes stop_codon:yes gene_type:complete
MKTETKAKLLTSLFPVVIVLVVGVPFITPRPELIWMWMCIVPIFVLALIMLYTVCVAIYSMILQELEAREKKKDNKPR